MPDRVRYEGVVHWVQRVMLGVDRKHGPSTQEPFVGFLCTGLLHPVKSAVFVRDNVDCMTCLVTLAREGGVYVRFR